MQNILTADQIESAKVCGKILKNAIFNVQKYVKAGISTKKLDQIAEESILKAGAIPSFKNYEVNGIGAYPASLCVSINSEVVHGIPSEDRILHEGDIVSLDLGAKYEGICTDMAITVPVGKISAEKELLIKTARTSLDEGIKVAKAGARIGAIGAKIQEISEKEGFSVIRDLVGHGIGEKPHLKPNIPNFGDENEGPVIEEGMALAIEPMIALGDYEIKTKEDGWTIETADGLVAAHFEHTIIIINGEPLNITA